MRDHSSDWERQPSLSSRGLAVAWKDMRVSVTEKQSYLFKKSQYKRKEILNGVSGAVQAETLTAILGASGSGKSTLMSVLANRNPADLQIEGRITIGGKPKGEYIRYVSGFVYQDDLFIPSLTVTEHLNFTAKLRLGTHISEKARLILIEDIINLLGLTKVAHNRIGKVSLGNDKVTLSGGEKKRLSIATELITDPGLLFCDEPTTGLDSFTALNVMTYLKSLTILKQKTIICSIHQPNAQIFGLFHQIILLSKGKIAFSGASEEAVSFFEENGYKLNEDENPAEYLIKSIATKASSSVTGIDELCSTYESSKYYKNTKEFIEKELNSKTFNDSVVFYKPLDGASWIKRLIYLTHRSLLSVGRDLSIQRMRSIQKLLCGLLIGLCLQGSVTWTQTGLTALKGVVFLLLAQNFFPAIHVTLNAIPQKMPLFYREYANNVTTPLIFYLSNVLSWIPGFVLDPVLFTLLICVLTGLTSSVSVILGACAVTTMLLNISGIFGVAMSLIFKRIDVANTVILPIDIVFIICSGVYIKLSTVPWTLRWIRYISWFTYACETLFIIETYGVTDIECDVPPDVPCIRTGDEILASYDFDAANLWPNIINMCIIYFVLHFIAYVALLRRLKKRKA